MLNDPDVSDRDKFTAKRRYCFKCHAVKPNGAHHCSTCGRCVNRMDHHCPWVNNCVGERNLKYFLQFLLYVGVGSSYAMALLAFRLYAMVSESPEDWLRPAGGGRRRRDPHVKSRLSPEESWAVMSGALVCAFSFVLCIFFLIFVTVMGFDQWEALKTGTPGVDAMQDIWTEEDIGLWEGLKAAMKDPVGSPGWLWRWSLPVTPRVFVGRSANASHPLEEEQPPLPPGEPSADGAEERLKQE